MSIDYTVDVSHVVANLHAAVDGMIETALDALFDGGEHILDVSNQDVPLDTADLQRSGQVTIDRNGMRVAVSYDTLYAVIQHEVNMAHANGRSWKFLERATESERDVVIHMLMAAIIQRYGL